MVEIFELPRVQCALVRVNTRLSYSVIEDFTSQDLAIVQNEHL